MDKKYEFLVWIICLILGVAMSNPIQARDTVQPRYSAHSFTLGTGTQSVYTDQVSPFPYKGLAALIQYQGQTYTKKPRLSQDWQLRLTGALPRNPAQTRQGQYLGARAHYGLFYRLPGLIPNLDLSVGGLMNFEAQVFYQAYLPSNPPIASHIQLNVEGAFKARYRFQLGSLPVEAHYALSIPLIGAGFYPDFGLSYAQIFMRQTLPSTYIGLSAFHRRFAMDHQVALDLVFKRNRLRLSYLHHSYWTYAKGIHTEGHLNTFNIGLVLDIANLSGRRLQHDQSY